MAEIVGTKKPVPGFTGEEHPEIVDIRAMLPQPKELKPGQVPESMIKQYFEEGYMMIEKFFDPEELNPCRDSIAELVEELAQKLYKGGKIKDLHRDADLFHRLTELDKEFPGANILLHKTGKLPQSFMDIWGNERLLNLIEQIIGSDIAGMPDWSYDVRYPVPTRPLYHGIRVDEIVILNKDKSSPSHDIQLNIFIFMMLLNKDLGYQSVDAYKTLVVTVWIPFIDANQQNGCMQLVPKGHLKGKVGRHYCCWGDTWYVTLPEEEMKDTLGVDVNTAKTFPVPYGGILVFSNFLPHRSMDNVSDNIRWSVDFRFKKTGLPNGMHGLKDDVILRSSADPNMKVDWSEFSSIERLKLKLDKEGNRVDVSIQHLRNFGRIVKQNLVYEMVKSVRPSVSPSVCQHFG
ncbi:hypothetical protein FSP39_018239 [Pinctada imbricata]|uniref:Phytanoyl-CoA dioxygenase n=1 Tax=Pinctada imbricata TaxID=66713 RepID=A0AA88XXC6_PINIB|nr:hypothetical protein FSP39_018239 [Pinctada imbricata]